MVEATELDPKSFCLRRFTGDYAEPLGEGFSKTCFEDDVCAPGKEEPAATCDRP